MSSFLYENHQGSLTLTLPNALGVLGVLGVLNVLIVCLICPWTHRWPAEPCFFKNLSLVVLVRFFSKNASRASIRHADEERFSRRFSLEVLVLAETEAEASSDETQATETHFIISFLLVVGKRNRRGYIAFLNLISSYFKESFCWFRRTNLIDRTTL